MGHIIIEDCRKLYKKMVENFKREIYIILSIYYLDKGSQNVACTRRIS